MAVRSLIALGKVGHGRRGASAPAQPLDRLADADEEASAGAELGGADANAGAVADLVDLVEGVDQVEADVDLSEHAKLEPALDRKVHDRVRRAGPAVGDVAGAAQARSVDQVA